MPVRLAVEGLVCVACAQAAGAAERNSKAQPGLRIRCGKRFVDAKIDIVAPGGQAAESGDAEFARDALETELQQPARSGVVLTAGDGPADHAIGTERCGA